MHANEARHAAILQSMPDVLAELETEIQQAIQRGEFHIDYPMWGMTEKQIYILVKHFKTQAYDAQYHKKDSTMLLHIGWAY